MLQPRCCWLACVQVTEGRKPEGAGPHLAWLERLGHRTQKAKRSRGCHA